MLISDWSSDVCSSDLDRGARCRGHLAAHRPHALEIGPRRSDPLDAISRSDLHIAVTSLPLDRLAAVVVALKARQDDAAVALEIQARGLPFGTGEHLVDIDLAHLRLRQVAARRDARGIVGGVEPELADARVRQERQGVVWG